MIHYYLDCIRGVILSILIYKDNKITTDESFKWADKNIVGYLHSSTDELDFNKYHITNIHNDIIIKSKDSIFLRIPLIKDRNKLVIKAIIKNEVFIADFEDTAFVEFLKEKIYLHQYIDSINILLYLFEFISLSYTEYLLSMEEEVDSLFEKAVYDGVADMKDILKIKKQASLIKRYTTYYKSMLSYLDDEFREIPLYNKVNFVLDNTLNLVENVEASIYSCIDIYNSVISNKMNKTMQLLTTITVLTLPLTVVSGIFGMNFVDMPLIGSNFGFILALSLTFIIIVIELIYFKRKKYF